MNWFFLKGAPATYESTGVAFLAVWIFQFAFADTCSTITSGAMIGRTAWIGDLIYSFFVSGFIYPIIGHWAWGPDGFLAAMGSPGNFLPWVGTSFHDFAGSTVVHTIGGFIALAGAIVLGPRLGRKFKRDGGGPMMPHDLTIAASGGLLLWFGWYGFNPGSTLSAMDFVGIGRVAANTTLAACAAGLTAMAYAYMRSKIWDVSFTVNGFLAGLVAITCPCYWVTPTGSILLGGIAGVIVVMGVELLEWLRIDDPIGAVPVHGICGIWGTLSLGFFAAGQFGSTGPFSPDNSMPLAGLFYGGGFTVLKAQAIGSAIITLSTFGVSMVVMLGVNAMGLLRISPEGETHGLDLHEHGISAYPEYVISAIGRPAGMPVEAPIQMSATAPWLPNLVWGTKRTNPFLAELHRAEVHRSPMQPSSPIFRLCFGSVPRGAITIPKGRDSMKKVEAVIQPHKLDEVKDALKGIGIEGVTVLDVRGHGRQKGHTEVYRGGEYKVDFLPKVKLEMIVPDARMAQLVDTRLPPLRGAGKLETERFFVSSIDDVIRIRNGDRGEGARC